MTDEQRRASLARCEAATPGPWQTRFINRLFQSARKDPATLMLNQAQDWPDSEFIAAARTDLPAALDALDAKDAEIEALTAALRDISCRGIYGEGELPMTPSELREIARAALTRPIL